LVSQAGDIPDGGVEFLTGGGVDLEEGFGGNPELDSQNDILDVSVAPQVLHSGLLGSCNSKPHKKTSGHAMLRFPNSFHDLVLGRVT